MTPGIYLVSKPVGHTSFSRVRDFIDEGRRLGVRLPVCHGGALDPFAEGLLLLLAGEATRLMELLRGAPKTYRAEIAWGAETDNGDPLGRIVQRATAAHLTAQALQAALARFIGWQEQVPPATSNKRIGGERAYRKAHRGEVFELPPSRVYLHEARFVAHDLPRSSTLMLVTGGGYYVRALARDLGRATGALGHLSKLRRTAIGPWLDPGVGRREHLQGRALFPWLASLEIDSAELSRLRRGEPIRPRALTPPEWKLPEGLVQPGRVRAFLDGALVAVLEPRDGALHPAPALRSPL